MKANAFSRERDELRDRLNTAAAERDRAVAELAEAKRRVDAAETQTQAARAEARSLRQALENQPGDDSLKTLQTVAAKETRRAIAFARSKIPADHPALPWFDKTVSSLEQAGCMAVKATCAFYAWAKPRAILLYERGLKEVETRLAKK